MKRIELKMNEKLKYEVIKDLIDHKDSNGKISTNRKRKASLKLNISIRQVNRLIIKIKETGKSGFIHGNVGHVPVNKIDNTISKRIIELYEGKYQGLNVNINHFKDLLLTEEKINISYTALRNLLKSHMYISPKSWKRTKKWIINELKEMAVQTNDKKELEKIEKIELTIKDVHPRREKSKYFGEVIEMDASSLDWFDGDKTNLHLAIDDATGIVVGGYFDKEETLNGYYNLFRIILKNYGIPYSFLTDKRTVFEYESKSKKDEEKDTMTQFSYACKKLGTIIKTTSVPEAKGAIERLNESFQSRLRVELHLHNVLTIDEANKYLNDIFIPQYNKKFARDIKNYDSVFDNGITDTMINETLSIISRRVVDNGNSIKYNNDYYRIFDGSVEKYYTKGTKVLVIKTFDNNLICSVEGKIFNLERLNINKEYSTNFDIENNVYKVLPKRYSGTLESVHWEYDRFDKFCSLSYMDKIKTMNLTEGQINDIIYS